MTNRLVENLNITICGEGKAIYLLKQNDYDCVICIHDPVLSTEGEKVEYYKSLHELVKQKSQQNLFLEIYDVGDIDKSDKEKICEFVDLLKMSNCNKLKILFFCEGGFSRSPMTAVIFMKHLGLNKFGCIKHIDKKNSENIIRFIDEVYST